MFDQIPFDQDKKQLEYGPPPPLLKLDKYSKKQLFEIFFQKDEKVNCGCFGKQIPQCIHCNGTQKLSIDQEIQSEIEEILLKKISEVFPTLQKLYAEKHKIQLQDINQFIDYHKGKIQQDEIKKAKEQRQSEKSQSQSESASKILPYASNNSVNILNFYQYHQSQRNSEIVQQQQSLIQLGQNSNSVSQSTYLGLGRQSNQFSGRNSNSPMLNSGGITNNSSGAQCQYSAYIVAVTPQQQQASSESSITFNVELQNNGKEIWPDNLKLKRIDDTDKLQEARVRQVAVGSKNVTQIMIFTPKNEGKYTAKVKLTYTNEKGKEISFGPPINLNFEVKPLIEEMMDAVIDFFDYDVKRRDLEIETTKFYSSGQEFLQLKPRKEIIESYRNYVNDNYMDIQKCLRGEGNDKNNETFDS